MLTVVFALRMGNIHEDIMALVEVSLRQANTDRQRDTFVRFRMRDFRPGSLIAALLVDNIACRRGQSRDTSSKCTYDGKGDTHLEDWLGKYSIARS